MFRKRRRPTPGFKIPPPYNPMQGEQANLRQDGVSPYCAMMQIAAEDIYTNHVICRGFDPRILRFIDYASGNADKPGISVAKPFGKRIIGAYGIGEVYPAMLPTQGNADFSDFRNVTYTPPSPVNVDWRVGQNPGVASSGLDRGHPDNLSDAIRILYDHNGKVINWLLIDNSGESGGGGGDQILFRVVDVICGSETSVIVEWTHFTGGCNLEPPGGDPYTGYITVFDSCILGYYTVDFLLSGADGYGATGRATYWYPRNECVGRWIVDSICGQPECA